MMEQETHPFTSRKKLPHEIPHWIDPSAETYFITANSLRRGTDQLTTASAVHALLQSAAYRHESNQWFIHLFLLMPDHIHALLSFPAHTKGIQHVIKSWKAWTAKHLHIEWQRNFFEHRLRAGESASEKFHYILRNPVRANLANTPDQWPWLLWSDPRGGVLQQGWGTTARAFSAR